MWNKCGKKVWCTSLHKCAQVCTSVILHGYCSVGGGGAWGPEQSPSFTVLIHGRITIGDSELLSFSADHDQKCVIRCNEVACVKQVRAVAVLIVQSDPE